MNYMYFLWNAEKFNFYVIYVDRSTTFIFVTTIRTWYKMPGWSVKDETVMMVMDPQMETKTCPRLVKEKWTETASGKIFSHMGRIKRIGAFKHEQNVLIQICMLMRKVSSGPLLSIHTFCSSQWFCLWSVMVRIRLCRYTGWSRHLLSAYARRQVFLWQGTCNKVFNLIFTLCTYVFQNYWKDWK